MKHFKNINLAALILVGVILALGVLFGVIAFPKETLAAMPFMGLVFGTVYSESNYDSDVVLDELNKDGSREKVTVLSGQNLAIGTVLGKALFGGVTETHAGNTGNGVMTPDATTPALANAQVGVYSAKCITASANGGAFEVFDPHGNSLGIIAVAATFANQIKFVIADGATDFIVGDTFLVTVAAGTLKVKILTPAALDGTQIAYGIICPACDASLADVAGAAIVRNAIVKDTGLVWPGGISAGDKAAALAALAGKYIISREAV